MTRAELRRIAAARLQDARILLENRRYGACYYLSGYAVECALKACIARQFKSRTIPDPRIVKAVYQHDLEQLVRIAGLQPDLDAAARTDPDLQLKWLVAADWAPDARYRVSITKREASSLFHAVADPHHGVLQWLQRYW